MSYNSRRAARIRAEVPILDFLIGLGYPLRNDYQDREQQFLCDLHGDTNLSARVYPQSNSWYCFGCHKSRDAISTAMEKLGLNFTEACRKIEQDFGLAPLSLEDDEIYQPKPDIQKEVSALLDAAPSFEEEQDRVRHIMDRHTRNKTLGLPNTLRLWEFFDKVSWMVGEGVMPIEDGRITMAKLRSKIQAAVAERATA